MIRPFRISLLFTVGVSIATLLASTSLSKAGLIIVTGPPGVNTDQNLVFNDPGLVSTGTTVTGATNNTQAVLNITSFNGEVLNTPSGGQARVEQSGGANYSGLYFTPNTSPPAVGSLIAMTNFTNFEFNVNAAADGVMTLEVFLNGDGLATLTNQYSIDQAGQNFFGIQSTLGDVITGVRISTSPNNIELVRQIRLGGVNTQVTTTTTTTTTGDTTSPNETGTGTTNGTTTPIPEPITLAVWGVFGGGMAVFGRRKRTAGATAV